MLPGKQEVLSYIKQGPDGASGFCKTKTVREPGVVERFINSVLFNLLEVINETNRITCISGHMINNNNFKQKIYRSTYKLSPLDYFNIDYETHIIYNCTH